MKYINLYLDAKYIKNYGTEERAKAAVKKLKLPDTVRYLVIERNGRFFPVVLHSEGAAEYTLTVPHAGILLI